MAGNVTLPGVGPVSRRALWFGGGAAVLVMGIVWWRIRSTPAPAPAGDTTADAGLADTGIAGGGGAGGGGGGGSSSTSSSTSPTSNPQWTQLVMQDLSGVIDASALAAALGLYLTGGAVTKEQELLIDQAIAVAGYPPVAGPNGYPPAIRTQPATGQTPQVIWAPGTTQVVHSGDTIASIATYYGRTVQELQDANPGLADPLRVGSTVVIPSVPRTKK